MPRGPREFWRSIDRRILDAVACALLIAAMVVALAGRPTEPGERASGPLAYALAILICLPILTHRRWALGSTVVASAALVAYGFGHYTAFPGVPLFVLTFLVALHADRRRSAASFGVALAAFVIALSLQPASVATASTWVSTVLALAVAWLAGENLRDRRARWAALEQRARDLERDREDRARRAVGEERLRIARELHDVVAHAMSVVAVQAGVANHVIDSRPEAAREALATVETNTRAALVEMRRLLGVLRQGDEPSASLAPAPGLAEVPVLVQQFAQAGLTVDVRVDGAPGAVPDGVDLSAYRIVQEGLTNVLRHGGPRAEVVIGYPGSAVAIEITDDGRGGGPSGAGGAGGEPGAAVVGPGHGLIGMRERVAVFGGRLFAGPRDGGGFRVAAVLPFEGGTP